MFVTESTLLFQLIKSEVENELDDDCLCDDYFHELFSESWLELLPKMKGPQDVIKMLKEKYPGIMAPLEAKANEGSSRSNQTKSGLKSPDCYLVDRSSKTCGHSVDEILTKMKPCADQSLLKV